MTRTPMSSAPPLTAPHSRSVEVPRPHLLRAIARHRTPLFVVGLTLLTFLMPSAPTYDPWAWIVWGREVLHLDLSTVDGPSWKPLPVLLTTPFALFAVDRHLEGRRPAAFAFATGAALLRPEAWPFLFAYGAWLWWRDGGARRVVAVGFALMPLLWLLPEWWGSGDLLRAAHRAH